MAYGAHLPSVAALMAVAARADGSPPPLFEGGGYKSPAAKERDRALKAAERARHSEEKLSKAEAKRARKRNRRANQPQRGEVK